MEKETASHFKRIIQHIHELVKQNSGTVCTGSQRHGEKEQEIELKLEQFVHVGTTTQLFPKPSFIVFFFWHAEHCQPILIQQLRKLQLTPF